ncbi:MAG TPA: class I SAM-dependent methyltransferase [Rhizomicrobium sp.]|nr:class I SAM-dependent methyltransferase [Rhizomicrobium sp.]
MRAITLEDGRRAFGGDAANYDSARPDYPDWVFETLAAQCGLGPGARVFEIGPGTGLATRRLVDAGAAVTAIEPDERLAALLKTRLPAVEIAPSTFEDAGLPEARFDLGVSATAFHWMEQRPALAKVAALLRPGGFWAMWWNVFGDPAREDAFHDATVHLLEGGSTPSHPPAFKHPFALDEGTRRSDLGASGLFADIAVRMERWTLVLDPAQTRALYATFSQFAPLEPAERDRILDALAEIAATQFRGRVERNMVTALYGARRV